MYWYVKMIESDCFNFVFVGMLLALATIAVFFTVKPKSRWCLALRLLYRSLIAASVLAIFLVSTILLFVAINKVAPGFVCLQVKGNELTGKVFEAGESSFWGSLASNARIELEREIEGVRDTNTSDSGKLELEITAVVEAGLQEMVYQIWQASDEKPGSAEKADENLLKLMAGCFGEELKGITLAELEDDSVKLGIFTRGKGSIDAALRENGLVLRYLHVKFRRPAKLLGVYDGAEESSTPS